MAKQEFSDEPVAFRPRLEDMPKFEELMRQANKTRPEVLRDIFSEGLDRIEEEGLPN